MPLPASSLPYHDRSLVSLSELATVFHSVPKSAADMDGVTAKLLENIREGHLDVLLHIVNFSLEYARVSPW